MLRGGEQSVTGSGLALHLPFDGSGSTAVDRAGDNDARVEGASRVEGRAGSALGFDGSSYAVVDDAPALQLSSGTISLHVRPSSTDDQGFVSKDATGRDEPGHLTMGVRGGDLWTRLQSTGDNYVLRGPAPATGEWHHVVLTFGDGATLYLDGDEVDSLGTDQGLEGNSNPLVVGASAWGSSNGGAADLTWYLDGAIDDLRLYGDQRTPSEVPVPTDDGRDGRYGGYATPARGTEDWHEPVNDNFDRIEVDVEALADRVAALGAARPDVGGYDRPARGTGDWHEPLNQNFDAIGSDLEAIAQKVEQLENS